MKKTSIILAVGSGLFFGQAQAEIESEFHVGYNTDYVFRGVDLGRDAYEYGFNFGGSCECGVDWSAGIWGISPDGPLDEELDIYAGLSKSFGGLTVSAGFTAYTYDAAPDDAEVYLGLAGEIAGLSAGVTAFFGTDGVLQEQILLEGTLGYSFEFNDKVSASLGLVYGYVADEGDGGYAADTGSAYYSLSLGVDIALNEDLTLSPYISYVDGDADTLVPGTLVADEDLIGGAKLSFSF